MKVYRLLLQYLGGYTTFHKYNLLYGAKFRAMIPCGTCFAVLTSICKISRRFIVKCRIFDATLFSCLHTIFFITRTVMFNCCLVWHKQKEKTKKGSFTPLWYAIVDNIKSASSLIASLFDSGMPCTIFIVTPCLLYVHILFMASRFCLFCLHAIDNNIVTLHANKTRILS